MLSLLGVSVASDLSWNEHISFVAKSTKRKIGSGLGNFSHPCSSSKPETAPVSFEASIATPDAIQKRAVRQIDDSTLTDFFDLLAHGTSIFHTFYRYHDMFSDELKWLKNALCVARVLPITNSLSGLNWKSAGPLDSLICLLP